VPTANELLEANGRTIPDVIRPGLNVLFCGINPGLWSAWSGHHFARPGNRFWPALHRGGFTPCQLRPDDQAELLQYGLGITNVVARGSARADELTRDELVAGGVALAEKVAVFTPRWLAVLGVTAYRAAFAAPKATIGRQERTIGATKIWVLPNPSGLNASWTTPRLVEAFGMLRRAAGVGNDDV
jgi:TDG/mug DNA glycosylase family protein